MGHLREQPDSETHTREQAGHRLGGGTRQRLLGVIGGGVLWALSLTPAPAVPIVALMHADDHTVAVRDGVDAVVPVVRLSVPVQPGPERGTVPGRKQWLGLALLFGLLRR